MNLSKEQITEWFKSLQDDICHELESLDGKGKFKEDIWERSGGGGGRSRAITGEKIEKGGVNFSAVHGKMPRKISDALKLGETDFYATGVSIVLHPRNPFVPIIHMNVRYFETSSGPWWFGGGIDLTPHYIKEADAKYFHRYLKDVCDRHSAGYYSEFKTWADNYFFIKHRDETRGVGGIFFDKLSDAEGQDRASRWAFVQDVGQAFVPIYKHLFLENKDTAFTPENKLWQYLRRGRYVEFNLVWDRGTKFGLDTNGRTESILMSMPPQAQWVYGYEAKPKSEEEKTLSLLKKGIHWAS